MNMFRRFVGLGAVALAGLPLAVRADAVPKARPNIVFILSDDQRFDCFHGAGNPKIITPAEDSLASSGVYFRQATIHITQCATSRATILTGLPPHENGWYSNQVQRKDVHSVTGFDQYRTVADLLRDSGYETILAGKWHILPEPWRCGFDEVGTWMPAGSGPYINAPLAEGKSRTTTKNPGFTQTVFTDSAIRMIRGRKDRSKPFFLWLAYTAPHTPLGPNPDSVKNLYAGKTNKELWPPNYVQDQPRDAHWKGYYTAISDMDFQVKRVLKTLDEEGLTTNTVVVFLGDNGLMMGSRNWHGKVIPYEESVRVPMIISAPGLFKGDVVSTACVSSLDLPPTFLALAGVKKPTEWPGRNLVPLLEGKKAKGFDHAICEFPDTENLKFGDLGYYLIRTPQYKLIDWVTDGKKDEFYDIQADPHEKKNLIDDASVAPVKAKLAKELADWKTATHVTPVKDHELFKVKAQPNRDAKSLMKNHRGKKKGKAHRKKRKAAAEKQG